MSECPVRSIRRSARGVGGAGATRRTPLVAALSLAALSLAAILLLPSGASPQETGAALQETGASPQETAAHQYHPEAEEAISKIRSPFCPGQTLEICPSWQAEALRDSIDQMAWDGLAADSLIELVVASHGEEYRGFPQRSGTGLLAWLMPPVALLLGLGLVVVALRRLRGPAAPVAEQGGLSEHERERLDAALAELEAMEDAE